MSQKSKPKEEFKTWGDVFDSFTQRTIYKLITQGHFEGLQSPISIGKESNVFSAVRKDPGDSDVTILAHHGRDSKCSAHLCPDVLVAPRLVAAAGLGVAVHGVANPGDHLPRVLHRPQQRRQLLAHLHTPGPTLEPAGLLVQNTPAIVSSTRRSSQS